ncbi:septum site-determining protein Ssd [Nocardioides bruguierae]|uniref:septum site-determining protein Ssd n=1 Tax=Nocardioides bruguierae TaxID=2945102 RepID=UPI0020220665|nr:septum site-determining protein Ssd [Nocardioides bruguierae]MCL8027473.1 septum site determining protein [Nocardioides bruguierae]
MDLTPADSLSSESLSADALPPDVSAASPVLLASRDPALVAEVGRLAAAAGVAVHLVEDAGAALRAWEDCPLVLLGADLLEELTVLRPRRRPGLHVLARVDLLEGCYRWALDLGATSAVPVPDQDAALARLLADVGEQSSPGRVVGVVAGSGGAGATTLACGLAQVGADAGAALVVDADPVGPGTDRVLGLEHADGVRWEDLAGTDGRLGARSLREAVPHRGTLGTLSFAGSLAGRRGASRRQGPDAPRPALLREVVDAARRGHDLVVVDLPRHGLDPDLVGRCDLVVVVLRPDLLGAAAAARVAATCRAVAPTAGLLRGRADDEAALVAAVGVPVLARTGEQRGVAESVDLGLGPVRNRRGTLGRACREVLDRLALGGVPQRRGDAGGRAA